MDMHGNGQRIVGIALLAACSMMGGAQAAEVYFCQQADGGTEVRDRPCQVSGGQTQIGKVSDYRAASAGMDYGRSGGARPSRAVADTADWIARTKAESRQIRAQRAASIPKGPGYRDEIRDRELRMRADEIREDIKKTSGHGLGSYGKARALGDQLRTIEQQRAYNWNNPLGY